MTARILCVLVLCGGAIAASAQQRVPPAMKLVLVDRSGSMTALGTIPGNTFAPRVSPDGRRVVFDTFDSSIWVADLSNLAAARRVITGRFPMWSADGTQLLFAGSDGTRLFSQAADGSGVPQLITDRARAPESWSAAAGLVSYITLTGETDYDVWAYSPRDRSMRALVAGPGAGQMRNGRLYAVRVRTEPRVEVAAEVELPIRDFVQAGARRQYDLTQDGKFLMMFP